MDRIEGRVLGARPGQQIIIFARSGRWWVQPLAVQPFTKIQPDSRWSSATHLGTEYAAVLVGSDYQVPPTLDRLPEVGGGVLSVAIVKGENPSAQMTKALQFSGYDWKIRSASSDRGGNINSYDPSNAWTDERGALHLRISKNAGQWRCAEVSLTRSLGYGLYRFVVRDTSHIEPAVVLGLFTWEEGGEDQNHREMDVEISRWGDALSKNAQFVVQPYYVPANVARFDAPTGAVTHSFRWKAGSVSFATTRGARTSSRPVAQHEFSSAIPTPGNELVHLNLYIYGNAASPPRNETEVVIEKFEFLP
ncbi:MAG TPA: glycoside hydrolase family 16 protein [Candidatus Saccharimonadales bacterium]|nr:glycoside hydrolase family 16 protein [Candidatus Saccharimonadales bacterium]